MLFREQSVIVIDDCSVSLDIWFVTLLSSSDVPNSVVFVPGSFLT